MEKIKLEFIVHGSMFDCNGMVVVMTLDERGKNYTVERLNELTEEREKLPWPVPKRVLTAFTKNAIDRILSKDEIPNESGFSILDGDSYTITITKGRLRKKYEADGFIIETYPLLRYLASWLKRR